MQLPDDSIKDIDIRFFSLGKEFGLKLTVKISGHRLSSVLKCWYILLSGEKINPIYTIIK